VSDAPDHAPKTDATRTAGGARYGLLRQVVEFVLTIAVAYFVAQGVRAWVVQTYVVPTGSMLPTIQLHDQVLANKFIYRFRGPERPDIVVLDNPMPHRPEEGTLIKRVIAVGGQTVDLRAGKVYVDGVALVEPYTYGQPSDPLMGSSVMFPLKVPVGSIWLMGDNRTQSQDSRWFGPVRLSAVQGQAFFTYWPLSRFGVLR
jgi:signal peptidase I